MAEKGIALVTGGSRGIGAACCEALAGAGFRVAIHCNQNRKSADDLSAKLKNSFVIQSDIGTIEGIDAIYDTLKKDHGGDVEVLVNNAGIAMDNPIFSASLDDFEKTINVNLRSVFYLTKRISRLMIRKKRGRVINMSSVVASTGNPAQAVYGMSKAAIENFTKTAAKELAEHGILVNAIAPGFIRTDMTEKIPPEFQEAILKQIPLGRMGLPAEIAEMVLFLAASGSYCTGSVFHINGGMYG